MNNDIAKICDLLETKNIEFTLIENEAVFTMEEIDELNLPKSKVIAKNLFLRDDKKRNYYLLVVAKEKTVNLKALKEKIASRPLSFASEKYLRAKLGLTKGAVTPFGVINDLEHEVKVFIDDNFKDGLVAVHPNANTATVWLRTNSLINFIKELGNECEFINI